VEQVLREKSLQLFAVEFSLDGMPEYHDRFRGMKNAFARAMETYRALADLQRRDARLRIHAISTATSDNLGQIGELTQYLFENCPAMDHHNLALIRGDRKNSSLGPGAVPPVVQYGETHVGAARSESLRLDRRADAAMGEDADVRSGAPGDSLHGGPAERRDLCQWWRERVRKSSADWKFA
jgi:hypothetical protein